MLRNSIRLGALVTRTFHPSNRHFFFNLVADNSKHFIPRQTRPATLDAKTTRPLTTMSSTDSQKPFIVRFYTKPDEYHPATRDPEGRTLDRMLSYNDNQLESYHDYIQYLFPLPEKSMVNPDAELIDLDTFKEFQQNSELRARLLEAFARMASFYGFDVSGGEDSPGVTPGTDFEEVARRSWLCNFDHNHLRITRIIRCLRVLGLEKVAAAFFQALESKAGNTINARSRSVWKKAATRPLNMRPDSDSQIGVKWLYDELNRDSTKDDSEEDDQ